MANTKITNHIVDKTFITGQTAVTAADGDYLLVSDASDSGALKKVLASDLIQTSEEVQDLIGAMFTSNTESGITVAYQDSDGTIDLTVGTLNQDTTGTAATVTTAAQPNITSLGTLTALTGGTGDLIWDTNTLFVDSSANKIYIGDTASHTDDFLQIESPASGGGHGIQIRRNDSNGDQGIGRIMFGNNNDTDLATIQATTDGQADSARLAFFTQPTSGNSTERMRIDASGNVGIGVTPSTWPSNGDFVGLQVGSGLSLYGRGSGDQDRAGMTANAYVDVNNDRFEYIASGHATHLAHTDGNFRLYTAPSGSANGAITFTERLTVLNAGNVGIGSSSPNEAQLLVQSTTEIATGGNYNDFGNLHVSTDTQGINNGGTISMGGLGRTSGPTEYFRFAQISGRAESASNGTPQGYMCFETTSGVTNLTTERMRIASGGNVGIGTTSPSGLLHVAGTSYFTNTMHMSGSGNLQFAGGIYPSFIRDGNDLDLRRQDTGAVMVTFTTGGATVASDERLKENITTITEATSKLKQLRGVTHTWKETMQDPDNADSVSYGLIAQEVEKVIPEVVHTRNSGEGYKSVSYEKLVPLLIETIKELEARIKTLEE